MNLLPAMILYLAVGCGEWYLALRRTLACARGEKVVLVSIVFIENLLGLWVLSNFVRTNNWLIALCYAAGGSAGALIVAMKGEEKSSAATRSATTRTRRRPRMRARSFFSGVTEYIVKLQPRPRRSPLQRPSQRIACPDG
jgi:hypothetical protein